MAKEVMEFIDWEFGTLLGDADPGNFSGAVGSKCSLVTSPTPPTGHTNCLKITQDKTNSYFRGPLFTFAVGTTCLTCAYIRVGSTNFPPANNVADFVSMIDQAGGKYWELRLNTSGWLQLIDQGGSVLDQLPLPLTDSWFRVEVVWQPGNSSANWSWYVTQAGTATGAAEGSGTTADFLSSGTTDIGIYLRGEGGLTAINPIDVFHGGCYIMEGVTDIEDRVGAEAGWGGDWQVFGDTTGRPAKANATPDCDEAGFAPSGDDLTTGLWNAAGDEDTGTSCQYSRLPAAAKVGGGVQLGLPLDDRVDYVEAGKWIWYGKANRTNGFKAVYGRFAAAGPLYIVTNEIAANVFPAGGYHRRIEDARSGGSPTYVPTVVDEGQFVIGMHNYHTFGRGSITTDLLEAGCFTLHSVLAMGAKPSIGTFGNMHRYQLSRPL